MQRLAAQGGLRQAVKGHVRSPRSSTTFATPPQQHADASSSAASSRTSRSPGPKVDSKYAKVVKRNKKQKDQVLRKAVEMYHLTPQFLPTPQLSAKAASPSFTNYESMLDSVIYSNILNTGSINRSSSYLTARGLNEYNRDLSNRAASVPSDGSTDGASEEMIKETQAFASEITMSTFITRQEREARAAAAATAAAEMFSKGKPKKPSSSLAALENFTDDDLETYQRRHFQGATSSSSSQQGADRLSHLSRIVPGANPWLKIQSLDARSARVRDAIFGTVNGELPGLEVVRERIQKMSKRAKKP